MSETKFKQMDNFVVILENEQIVCTLTTFVEGNYHDESLWLNLVEVAQLQPGETAEIFCGSAGVEHVTRIPWKFFQTFEGSKQESDNADNFEFHTDISLYLVRESDGVVMVQRDDYKFATLASDVDFVGTFNECIEFLDKNL